MLGVTAAVPPSTQSRCYLKGFELLHALQQRLRKRWQPCKVGLLDLLALEVGFGAEVLHNPT